MPFDILGAIFFFASIILYFLYYDNRTKKEELEKENENLREELLQLRNKHYNLSNELYKKSNDDFWHCVHLAVQHTQTKVPWIAKYRAKKLTDIIISYLSYAKVTEPKDIVLEDFEKTIRIALCASQGWLDAREGVDNSYRVAPSSIDGRWTSDIDGHWIPDIILLTDEESEMLFDEEYDFILESLPKQIPPQWLKKTYPE